jgi:hypothetical protein
VSAGTGVPSLDEDLEEAAAAPGRPTAGLRRARAWLGRLTEPGTVDLWRYVASAPAGPRTGSPG